MNKLSFNKTKKFKMYNIGGLLFSTGSCGLKGKNKKDKPWLSKKQKCVWNALYMGIYDLTILNVKSYYDILNII